MAGRTGHVSRARLFAEGSVLARRLQEQREAAAASQQQQQPEDAAATAPAADQQQQRRQANDASLPSLPPAQITWPELFDARTNAAYVGLELGQQEDSQKAMQLWWPPHAAPSRSQQHLKRRRSRLLHYSAVLSRVLQRSGSVPPQPTHGAAAAVNLTVTRPHELFGPPAKRVRLLEQQQQEAVGGPGSGAADWVCCNSTPDEDADDAVANGDTAADAAAGPRVCGASNAASNSACSVCGALRWDGPDGQAQARITAALQTADLDATSIRQVAARVLAESGSRPGVVGLLPQTGMQAEVLAVVHARKTSTAGRSRAERGRTVPAAAAAAPTASGARQAAGGGDGGADELELLEQYGCLPEAQGVYSALVTCLQQQQQRPQHSAAPGSGERLQSAAAAAAALAPGLLGSVLQQQGGLPAFNLEHGSVLSWVNECFEEAADAAVQAPGKLQQQQAGLSQEQPCRGMRRPLPLHTLLTVCDRRGAAVRQQLRDLAAGSVQACGGRLPLITRSYLLEGHELLSQQVAAREWLWASWKADTRSSKVLRAHEQGAAGDAGDAGDADGADGNGSEDDVAVMECITSENWEEVLYVRSRLVQLLLAWQDSLLQQASGVLQVPKQQHHQHQLEQQVQLMRRPNAWDRQMCRLLGPQVQRIRQGWGAAPTWALRQGLTVQSAAAASSLKGAAAPQQPPASNSPPHQGIDEEMPDVAQQQPQQQAPQAGGLSGARRSARVKAQPSKPASGQVVAGQEPASSNGGSSSSSESSSSGEADSDLHDADYDHSTDTQQRRRKRSRQQLAEGPDDSNPLQEWVDSLDDLLLPQQQQPAESSQAVSAQSAAWQPRASSQWRAVVGPAAAVDAADADADAGAGAGVVAPPSSWSGLPAGMQLVLSQAAAAGVAPPVLQRTAARLRQLLVLPGCSAGGGGGGGGGNSGG